MKNLLVVGVNSGTIDASVLDQILKSMKVNRMILLLSDKKDDPVYKKYGRCIYREDVAKGYFPEKEVDMLNCIPLDDRVFQYMAPYTIEILTQQRRFEEYHAFHIPATYESHYTIYMRNLFFWNNLLEREKITHVFLSCLPHEGYDSIIYHLSKQRKIPVRMFYNSTLPHRYYALSDYMNPEEGIAEIYSDFLKKYKGIEEIPLNSEEEKLYNKWASLDSDRMRPWYMEGDPLKRRFEIRFGCTNLWKAWERWVGNIYVKYDYRFCGEFVRECLQHIFEIVPLTVKTIEQWKYARPVWKRTLELNKFYDNMAEEPIEEERYIYYAMHYQPEASSNPLGGREYADQIFAIHLLAKCVPEGMKIYVKSHPEQLAPLRSKEYYQDIKRIPNVRLIKSKCETYGLIKNAVAVSSLTGTACWEAQFFGVPAILFGYSHKNLAPLSYHVRTIEECRRAIRDIEERKKKTSSRELKLMIKAMYEQSFDEKDWKKMAAIEVIDLMKQ